MNKKDEILVAAYMAGENVSAELLEACRQNPELLKELAELSVIDRLLAYQTDEASDGAFVAEVRERLQSSGNDLEFLDGVRSKIVKEKKKWLFRSVQLATLAAAVTLAALFYVKTSRINFVEVVKSMNSVWETQDLVSGDSLSKGVHTLSHGYSEVLFESGVRLLLEAPIQFNIKSRDLIEVTYGRMVAKVPEQAIGFTVHTPSSEVVDLGTEFGVSVDRTGVSEVHVLDGEVKARALDVKKYTSLHKDQGMVIDSNQQVRMIQSDPSRFMRALPGKSAKSPQYLHWSFDSREGLVTCTGTGMNGERFPGVLKGYKGGEGPSYENGQFGDALYFNGKDAFVETSWPGIGGHAPRTVAFWVKVPEDFSERNGYAILGWGRMAHGQAWQISPNPDKHEGPLGRLRVGAVDAPIIGTTDLRDNRWHHIAVVMYGGDQAALSTHVLMFVDGRLEKTSRKSIVRIDTELGHDDSRCLMLGRNMGFSDTSHRQEDKFFKGWVDEVFVFDTALEQEKIQQLMLHNRID